MSKHIYKNGREAKVNDRVFVHDAAGRLETGLVTGIESDGINLKMGQHARKVRAETAVHVDDYNQTAHERPLPPQVKPADVAPNLQGGEATPPATGEGNAGGEG